MKIFSVFFVYVVLASTLYAQAVKITVQEAPISLAAKPVIVSQPKEVKSEPSTINPITDRLITMDEIDKRTKRYIQSKKSLDSVASTYKKAIREFLDTKKKMTLLVSEYNKEIAKHTPLFKQHSTLAKTILNYQKYSAQLPIVKASHKKMATEIANLKRRIELKDARIEEIEKELLKLRDKDKSSNKKKLSQIRLLSEKISAINLLNEKENKKSDANTLLAQLSSERTEIEDELDNLPGTDKEKRALRLKIELSKLLGEVGSHKKRLEALKIEYSAASEFLKNKEPWLKEIKEKIPSLTKSFIELDKQVKTLIPTLDKVRKTAQAAIDLHQNSANTLQLATNAYEDARRRHSSILEQYLVVTKSVQIFYCNISELGQLTLLTKHTHFVLMAYKDEFKYTLKNQSNASLKINLLNIGDLALPIQGKHKGHRISVSSKESPIFKGNRQGTAYIMLKGTGTLNLTISARSELYALGNALNISISK